MLHLSVHFLGFIFICAFRSSAFSDLMNIVILSSHPYFTLLDTYQFGHFTIFSKLLWHFKFIFMDYFIVNNSIDVDCISLTQFSQPWVSNLSFFSDVSYLWIKIIRKDMNVTYIYASVPSDAVFGWAGRWKDGSLDALRVEWKGFRVTVYLFISFPAMEIY